MLLADYSLVITFIGFCLIIDLSHQVAIQGENAKDAIPGEFPSVVSIGIRGDNRRDAHFCTGTLISKKHVLTAAHCLEDEDPVDVDVTVGSIDIEQGTKYYPSRWKTYAEWKRLPTSNTMTHDIAIITLNSSVADIEPSVITKRKNLTGSVLKIAGWGYDNNHEVPTVLKTALLEALSKDECSNLMSGLTNRSVVVRKNTLCIKADPWILSNEGDSGGPSFDDDNKLVGVTRGRGPQDEYCVLPPELWEKNKVILQMDAYYYRDFINSVTKKEACIIL